MSGYLAVTLTHRSGRCRLIPVHQLVAAAFLGDPPQPGMEINHKDADRQNPVLTNLEWVTRSENRLHGYRVGFACAKGERNGFSKLTDGAVVEIRRLAACDGSNWPDLATRFNVSRSTIRDVATGRTWAHVTQQKPTGFRLGFLDPAVTEA